VASLWRLICKRWTWGMVIAFHRARVGDLDQAQHHDQTDKQNQTHGHTNILAATTSVHVTLNANTHYQPPKP
jgi:hypothetical protein